MNVKRCLAYSVMLFLAAPGFAAANIVYSLADPGLTGGYGFSGTITTDGSLGFFSSSAPILSWDITILTPAGVDGTSVQSLTPSNSVIITSFIPSGAGLELTSSTIHLVPSLTLPTSADLVFDVNPTPPEGFERLFWTVGGDDSSALRSRVGLSDLGETPSFADLFGVHDALGVLVATVIPEPTTCALALAAVVFLAAGRRRGG